MFSPRFLLAIACAVLASLHPKASAAEPKRVIVCTVTTGFRHSCIPLAEKTLQQLADDSKAFTIVDFSRQPEKAPQKPNKPKDIAADADEKAKAKYADELKKYDAEMAKWTPEFEAAAKEKQAAFSTQMKESLAKLDPAFLKEKKIDGVIFACTTGDLPLPDKEGFIKWIEEGHAFIGMHSASDTFHGFPRYLEMLGGEFKTHGAQVPADLVQADPAHPATAGLPANWNISQEEMYELKNQKEAGEGKPFHDRSKLHVLWFLRHPPQKKDVQEYAGVSWCKMAEKGRIFYTSLGHREDLWSADPEMKDRKNSVELAKQYQQHILGGIKWALGLEEGSATPNPEVK